MPLAALILKNLWSKKARSIGIAFAISIAVMTVVTLTVVSSGLEASAAAVLTLGHADFTVARAERCLGGAVLQPGRGPAARCSVDAWCEERGGGPARDAAHQREQPAVH